jgi:hypothetical protein
MKTFAKKMDDKNTTNFLSVFSNEDIKEMFEEDIATTARQACDLRHPNVLMQVTDKPNERQFEAFFCERLSKDDREELTAQLQHNFGEENILVVAAEKHFIPVAQLNTTHVFKVVLHVAK